jgi:hypothetical protein
MNARRIAEKILEGTHHCLGRDGVDRGGGVVIEVDAHGEQRS